MVLRVRLSCLGGLCVVTWSTWSRWRGRSYDITGHWYIDLPKDDPDYSTHWTIRKTGEKMLERGRAAERADSIRSVSEVEEVVCVCEGNRGY
eukprot:COSAG02_NODE_27522_length_607_cov_6.848425_1_plen_91_part_01